MISKVEAVGNLQRDARCAEVLEEESKVQSG